MILYDVMPSGFLNQVCLCAAKLSISGAGITGIIPILTMILPAKASTFDMTGLATKSATNHAEQQLSVKDNSLSIHSTEISLYGITTVGSFVFVDFEGSISVFDVDFVFFHDEICRDHRP